MTKWELKVATSLEEAQKLAADGWEPFAVANSNGDEWVRIYLKRELKK